MSNFKRAMLGVLFVGTYSLNATEPLDNKYAELSEKGAEIQALPDCDDLSLEDKAKNAPCREKTFMEKVQLALKAAGGGIGAMFSLAVMSVAQPLKEVKDVGRLLNGKDTTLLNDFPLSCVKACVCYGLYKSLRMSYESLMELGQ